MKSVLWHLWKNIDSTSWTEVCDQVMPNARLNTKTVSDINFRNDMALRGPLQNWLCEHG